MSNVSLKGTADGREIFVPELGCKTPTFTTKSDGRYKPLAYHVPPTMRGAYRPNELANFDPEKDYRTDNLGYVLCNGVTANDIDCLRKAQNRSLYCELHGGSLHSDDKFIREDQSKSGETQALSRYKQFLAGQITVEDLDDEELATCGFRATNGRIYKPKNVPRDLAQGFTKAIYERAQTQLRALTVDAVDTIGEIMKNNANEPDIRLKAALSVIERNLGKPTQTIAVTADKPFEEVFSDVFQGTREQSRQRRAIESERVYAEEVPLDSERPNPVATDSPSYGGDSNLHESPIGQSVSADTEPNSVLPGEFSSDSYGGLDSRDPGMFSRNEAVLAQTIELKPFEYDLSDKRDQIIKATKKRYAARALGFDPDAPNVPFIREEKQLADGTWHVKHIDPQHVSVPMQSKGQTEKRKAYTLSDF